MEVGVIHKLMQLPVVDLAILQQAHDLLRDERGVDHATCAGAMHVEEPLRRHPELPKTKARYIYILL